MRTHSISSSKKGSPPYTVTLGGEEGDTCECKAFQFCQAEPPTCKHITEARRIEDEQTEGGQPPEGD